jgi:large subunit ribosomal protein L10
MLVAFAKDFKQFQLKCGQISGKTLNVEAIKRLAELPGKDELLAKTFAAMQAVPASLVWVLNGLIVQLLNVLKAIERKNEQSV